jgi:hypothetical protein
MMSLNSKLAGLSIEDAIRLRWALRDIKAKRTKMSPVSDLDPKTLIEKGLVEMRDDLAVSAQAAGFELVQVVGRRAVDDDGRASTKSRLFRVCRHFALVT